MIALDRAWHVAMTHWVEHARAPHYTDVARALGVAPDDGRQLVHDLIATGLPNWLYPGTDLIASFAPFHALPTPHRISVGARSGWYGQCAPEAVAASWLFPAQTITIDAPCLDCGESLQIALRDGRIERAAPEGVVAYVGVPFREWRSNLPYA